MARRKQNDHQEIAATLRAARLMVGESDAPMTSKEAATIKEVQDELLRPNEADLAALAQKLANR